MVTSSVERPEFYPDVLVSHQGVVMPGAPIGPRYPRALTSSIFWDCPFGMLQYTILFASLQFWVICKSKVKTQFLAGLWGYTKPKISGCAVTKGVNRHLRY